MFSSWHTPNTHTRIVSATARHLIRMPPTSEDGGHTHQLFSVRYRPTEYQSHEASAFSGLIVKSLNRAYRLDLQCGRRRCGKFAGPQ